MQRALQLASLGTKAVKNNPKVGAVLVYQNIIIGEGFHAEYGAGHAEVNCIKSVKEDDRNKISKATIYVTLEPCYHEGKTPPCVDLIIKSKIEHIVIGTLDPNPKVSGKSIAKLRNLGKKVTVGVLENECKELIAPFVLMMSERPWVILKFAKSKYNYMAALAGQAWLSTLQSKLYVHRMRSDVDGILIGTNTAMIDNPALTTRLVEGDHPTRIVLDRNGVLPLNLKIFTDGHRTIYMSSKNRKMPNHIELLIYDFEQENQLDSILHLLYQKGIYRLMIEGGATLLQSIVKEKLWNEAVVINTHHELNEGKKAPNLNGKLIEKIICGTDTIHTIRR